MQAEPLTHQSGSFIDIRAVAPLLIAVWAAAGHCESSPESLLNKRGTYSIAGLKEGLVSERYQL